jgi:hypothetical protein
MVTVQLGAVRVREREREREYNFLLRCNVYSVSCKQLITGSWRRYDVHRCTVSVKTHVGHANVKFRGGSVIVQLQTLLAEKFAVIADCWNSVARCANCAGVACVRVGETLSVVVL